MNYFMFLIMCISILYGTHYLYSQFSQTCELVSTYEKYIRYEHIDSDNDKGYQKENNEYIRVDPT